jgi:hypothetical protein
MHGADQIHAEWQNLKVGDVLRSRAERPGMRVEILDPERVLSNRSEAGDWVWTDLCARPRRRLDPPDQSQPNRDERGGGRSETGHFVMERGSLVMERKMLLGIKQQAERSLRQR